MAPEQEIFKITTVRFPEKWERTIYVIGDLTIDKNIYFKDSEHFCNPLRVVQDFIRRYQKGQGEFQKNWDIKSVEIIGSVFEIEKEKQND